MTSQATKSELRSKFLKAAGEVFADVLGMEPRKKHIFQSELAEGVHGWLGITVATNTAGGGIAVAPSVGVRHDVVQELESKLMDIGSRGGAEPTVSGQIGYLMPYRQYVEWSVPSEEDIQSCAEEMASGIAEFGVPYIERNARLPELLKTLRAEGLAEHRATRVPLVLMLLGRSDEALTGLNAELEALNSRTDPAADLYRGFAHRFRAYVAGELQP
jgi:hypothetical protein